MKKNIALLLVFVLAICSAVAFAEGAWICPSCSNENSGNFCGNCGTARPGWVCASCSQENKGNFCTNCGAPKVAPTPAPTEAPALPAADLFTVTPSYTVLHDDLLKSLFYFPADAPAFPEDYAPGISLRNGIIINNNSETEQMVQLKMQGTLENGTEKSFSWTESTIAPGDFSRYTVSSAVLPTGTHHFTIYINDVAVKEVDYVIQPGHSQTYTLINNQLTASAQTILYDQNAKKAIDTMTEAEYLANKDHLTFSPCLKVWNFSSDAFDLNVSVVLNQQKVATWNPVTLADASNHIFRYTTPSFQDGINELIWYINGMEVLRQTIQMDLDAALPHALPEGPL